MVSRRRGEPHAAEILRYISDHESLQIVLDEYPNLTDDRLRQVLSEAGKELQNAGKPTSGASKKRGNGAIRSVGDRKKLIVCTDGASRGNPGPAGAGWVITDLNGTVVDVSGVFLGKRTNNEAEYEAVIAALQAAASLGGEDISLRTDSELLVRQINGRYRVKNDRLLVLHEAARDVIHRFKRFDIKHISREQNEVADAEANRAIDEAE